MQYFIMKFPKKRKLQQIEFNNSSDIDYKDFMNLHKKNVFQNYILFQLLMRLLYQIILCASERISKLIMAIDKIRDEKVQYDINIEVAEISALSLGKLINMNILQVKKYYLLIKTNIRAS